MCNILSFLLKNQFNTKVRIVRIDNGTKFFCVTFLQYKRDFASN